MKRLLSHRIPTLLAALALVLGATGCADENPVAPDGGSGVSEGAPVLPAPERLDFDFSFFNDRDSMAAEQDQSALRGSKRNFFNAYVRAVTIQAITHLVLTPPVAAFSIALHTIPSPQADGSYIWVYTYVDGEDEAQIRLKGTPLTDRVMWELRVSNTAENPPLDKELWFEGETWNDADEGFWRFYDFNREGGPLVARIDWGEDADGEFLRFTDLDENPGDTLEYRDKGALGSITLTDADTPDATWFIKWNELDGTGSLRAPDYNGGEEACWDENQDDCVCPGATT
jgi:hypothetical protein